MDYQVKLETFQGPLDLLLYLVKRSEIDILDIPIARVTDQFLQHLHVIEMIDVEHAGEFLVMAATLMEIKSRLLLPRSEDEADAEGDPRLELVKQLIEYRKFKEAALLLESRAEWQITRLARVPLESGPAVDLSQQPLQAVELWDLVSAFGRLMRETLALQPQQIVVDETPIQVHQDRILDHLAKIDRLPFTDLFVPPKSKARFIGMFLAVLELIRSRRIAADQSSAFGEIWIRRLDPTPNVTNGQA